MSRFDLAAALAPFEASLKRHMPNGWPDGVAERIAGSLQPYSNDEDAQRADDAWTERGEVQ